MRAFTLIVLSSFERTGWPRACSSAWLEHTLDKRGVGSSNLPRPTRYLAGGLAQLGERLVCNQEVTGSSPVFSTSLLFVAGLVSLVGWKFWTRGWCSFSVSECDAPD